MGEPRTRTDGGNDIGVVNRKTWQPNGSLSQDVIYKTDGVYQYKSSNKRTITDEVTKNFKKLRSEGHVIMSPLTITRRKASSSQENYTSPIIPGWGQFAFSGDSVSFYAVNPADPVQFATRTTEAQAWTLQEAYSKVAQEDFMAFVTVAEAKKTASMIASPFKRADELLRKLNSRKLNLVRKGLNVGGAISSAWLEYRLGWKPLLYDLEGIWDAYIANTESFTKPTRIIARRSFKHSYELEAEPYTSSAPFLGGVPMVRSKVLDCKVASGVLYEIHDASLEDATLRRMGLRLSDVPASVWELVPFSFVLDRFLAVGSWLSAITPKPGVKVLGSWTTTVSKAELFYKKLDYTFQISGYNVFVPGGQSMTDSSVTIQRVANPSTSSFAVPVWNPKDLSFQQTVDHAALIYEGLRGFGFTRK